MTNYDFEHQSQDSRQSLAEALDAALGAPDERVEALRRRLEIDEASKQGMLGERAA